MCRRSLVLLLACLLATLAAAAWIWHPGMPLGVPGEWTWSRIDFGDGHLWAWMISAAAAAGFIGIVAVASTPVARAAQRIAAGRLSTLHRSACLATVVMAAAAWWFVLLSAIPPPFGLVRAPIVLYFPRMTGYYWEARYATTSTAEFLASYEDMLRERDDAQRYLHIGTHPPGMIFAYRGLVAALRAAPEVVGVIEQTMPASVEASLRDMRQYASLSDRQFSTFDTAALWLATLMTLIATALTIVPLTWLIEREGQPFPAALRWGALWAFVPSVCIFLPKCDVLFAPLTIAVGWCWLSALDRTSPVRAAMAGLLGFCGLFFSLAFVPVAAWLGLATLLHFRETDEPDQLASYARARSGRQLFAIVAGASAGFMLPLLLLGGVWHLNMIDVWRLNFVNHAEFYSHNHRSWLVWLAANVVELAMSVGPAVAVLAVAGILGAGRSLLPGGTGRGATIASAALVLGLLWVSGKNMGEAARLWIPFLPWLIVAAGRASLTDPESSRGFGRDRLWWWVAALQALFAILSSTRIDGFGFTELG